MECLAVRPIKTRIFNANENLAEFIVQSVPSDLVKEKMILAITSKIVSLAENCLMPKNNMSKKDLVMKEADVFLGEIGYGCFLTIKEGLLIPSAGIDESNSITGDYILYPKNPFESAKNIWSHLKNVWNVKELGVLITDSHTTPLRKGVTGICLSYWGFNGLKEMVGSEDLFGRKLQMTNINYADGLAASAVLLMGEGSESQPLAVLQGAPVSFVDQTNPKELAIRPEEDLYSPLFKRGQ